MEPASGASAAGARTAAALLLALSAVLAGCTAEGTDADGDGLDGLAEQTPRDITLHTANGTATRQVTSDPDIADTDGDGVTDGQEVDRLTDPRDIDSDSDGLLDGEDQRPEPNSTLERQMLQRGIVRDEDGRFLGEADAGTKAFDWDGDRPFPDGLGDGDELSGWNVTTLARGSYRVRSDPVVPDADGDSLSDLEEFRRGCDPGLADTEGDGVRDVQDADCTHDLRLAVAVSRIRLLRSLDAGGETDLLIEAQAEGLAQHHRQPLEAGDNNVTFRWTVDVADAGPPGERKAPLVLAFWDDDLAGDDDQGGVRRQPMRLFGAQHVLSFEVDLATRRWSLDGGPEGEGGGTVEGEDGSVTFTLQPLVD